MTGPKGAMSQRRPLELSECPELKEGGEQVCSSLVAEKGKEQRFTPSLNYSQEKVPRLFNKPWLYEARLTISLDSVEYYKLSGARLRTSTLGAS